MPRRHFLADLEKLRIPGAAGVNITDVRHGDDDGTFTFVYTAPDSTRGFEITGMVPELSDYPTSHQIYLYTTSQDLPAAATSAIEKISTEPPTSLSDLLHCISTGLTRAMAPGSIEDNDSENEDMESADGDEDDDVSVGGWSDHSVSERIDAEGDSQMDNYSESQEGFTAPINSRRLMALLRRDLRQAKLAGFKVGVLGDHKGGLDMYVSLGIRVSKLGISDEAISAWKLDKKKYIILLIHYSGHYQDLEKLTIDGGGYHVRRSMEMCVGAATKYKPTLMEAIGAFSKISSIEWSQDLIGQDRSEIASDSQLTLEMERKRDGFMGIFLSRPLNELLNSRLVQLVKYRVQMGFGWDGAEVFYNNNQGLESTDLSGTDDQYFEIHAPKSALPPIVTGDALSERTASAINTSFPLLAMQFALRHLVRCTEFCLICHNKVTSDFEALKPYVCSSPLCLYQYMSLGFGPSIEYEILSQPSVVDLLVSFCYVSAKLEKLNDFPLGMNLTVPPMSEEGGFTAKIHRTKLELHFDEKNDRRPPVKVGDWIMFLVQGIQEPFHARITESAYYPTIKLGTINGKLIASEPGKTFASATLTPTDRFVANSEFAPVVFMIYDTNFDILDDTKKRQTITVALDAMPSVREMKSWLERNTKVGEEASLHLWNNRMSPAILGILRWIIASNRSCIVPVGEDEDGEESNPVGGAEQKVWGIGEWKQFRFAMGAPDKEQRFVNAVRDAQDRLGLSVPSIFAFHGSPLANWHSIIREGLHFKHTINGRVYGHGCYHTLDHTTSLHYAGYASNQVDTWPQSVLKIRWAMSLNEIVNAPNEFVSKTPHLVVAQLDWIQTRYLFVQTTDKKTTAIPPEVVTVKEYKKPTSVHPQDPHFTPRGAMGYLIIPATVSRYQIKPPVANVKPLVGCDLHATGLKKIKNEVFSKLKKPKITGLFSSSGSTASEIPETACTAANDTSDPFPDNDSVATDTTDLLALLSDNDDDRELVIGQTSGFKIGTKRNHSSLADAETDQQKERETRFSSFIPGELDTSGISFLAPPEYATPMATKRLNTDLQTLIKLQKSTSLSELGFYINPNLVENVYQWIVELHSFDGSLPLVKDMTEKGLKSIVLEVRFGSSYPMSPPFIRIVKPRFQSYGKGGGGNVTIGGALCMELLTNSGWSAVQSLEGVFLQVRMAISDETRPARLEPGPVKTYGINEAKQAYIRACRNHGWAVPDDFKLVV